MNVFVRLNRDDFDSKLEIPNPRRAVNCVLRIELKIWLVRLDVTTFTRKNQTYRCRHWTDQEWRDFVFLYRHICEHYWNNRWWLQPPANFSELDLPLGRPTHRPNIKCELKLEIVTTRAARRHHRIRVVRLADDEREMRSASRTYDNRDNNPRSRHSSRTGHDYIQIPAVHEVAHLLNLHHPEVGRVRQCTADGNRDICYGRDHATRSELTGWGMSFTDRHAQPWLDRIADHTMTRPRAWTLLRGWAPPESLAVIGIRQRAGERMRERILRSVEDL
jgi:hypothetical protein